MPQTHVRFRVTTSPAEVMSALTDFGPTRPKIWPGIDERHYIVHGQGPDWADVTEGNSFGWERGRYDWDAEAHHITIATTDSNIWGPGSRWEYQLEPDGGGTIVDVRLTRHGKGVKGRLVGMLIPASGRMIRSQLTSVFKGAHG